MAKLLETKVLFAVFIKALTEKPEMASQRTAIEDFLALRSTKTSSRNDTELEIRGANLISKSANALLRGLRTAVCGALSRIQSSPGTTTVKFESIFARGFLREFCLNLVLCLPFA